MLVIGGGHSAANALLDLARLAEHDLRTSIVWAVRAPDLCAFSAAAALTSSRRVESLAAN